jgi:cellulose synthase/poly-beta-1,6-N-acetylglucosamine synthase-like glycosyltransferase
LIGGTAGARRKYARQRVRDRAGPVNQAQNQEFRSWMSKILDDHPLVSIIVDSYNYERYVGEAIDSALNQDYPNIEVVVVDDGSTDRSRDVIRGYDDRIVAVLKPNGGQGSAYKAGFEASHGGFVIFLDADDRIYPHAATEIMKHFNDACPRFSTT